MPRSVPVRLLFPKSAQLSPPPLLSSIPPNNSSPVFVLLQQRVGQNLLDLGVIVHVKGLKEFSASEQALYVFRMARMRRSSSGASVGRRSLSRSVSRGSLISGWSW